MCGRFAISSPAFHQIGPFDVREWFERESGAAGLWRPRFNIAPTQDTPVVVCPSNDQRGASASVIAEPHIEMMRWGLAPPWSRDPKRGPINARAETIATQPMFRVAFRQRRCVVPATGFYEWQGGDAPKQPWFISARDEMGLFFAGVWEIRTDEGRTLRSFAIVTTTPNEIMRPIHERMPAILTPAGAERWLDPSLEPGVVHQLLAPCDPGLLRAWRVSTRVNSPRHDEPTLIEPARD